MKRGKFFNQRFINKHCLLTLSVLKNLERIVEGPEYNLRFLEHFNNNAILVTHMY